MKEWQSQAHVMWECKYHVVIVPKCRKEALYGRLGGKIGNDINLKLKEVLENGFWKHC